jgi:hypothetical protein
MGTSHEDQYTFLNGSHSILRMRNFSHKSSGDNQNTHFMLFRAVYEMMWKNTVLSRAGHRWQYGACPLQVTSLELQTHSE